MKIYGADNKELMSITSLSREGRALPMTAKLRPEEARAALKMLDWRTALFLLTLVFRRSAVNT